MKYLIVNGDDFGAGRGVNRGILEAYRNGILTSTSLLVDWPGSGEAADLRLEEDLSVGLHFDLPGRLQGTVRGVRYLLRSELERQLARFQRLMGRNPTHLDAHHNVHRRPEALPVFRELAQLYGIPLRESSPVRYFSKFYGQWKGETHLEAVSAESLTLILRTEVHDGVTELGCHPGYADPSHVTSYSMEREAELCALCSPLVRRALEDERIVLLSYHDLPHVLADPAFPLWDHRRGSGSRPV